MSRLTTSIDELRDFVARHPRLFVLTGAGCSTDSGIPDYRDHDGQWKRPQPITLQAFVGDERARRRYWARSFVGWPMFERARPNVAHESLVHWQRHGRVARLVTQNVDRLHQRAGSTDVIDLHGRLDQVVCLRCSKRSPRAHWQDILGRHNRRWLEGSGIEVAAAPDGDADLEHGIESFEVPHCPDCGGLVKPDVVFFGETVPRERVDAAFADLGQSDAMLVVGSSLMVFSGYRFARAAAEQGKPIAAIALGRTRADDLLSFRLSVPCAQALSEVLPGVAASA